MEVSRNQFPFKLVEIIEHIANSHFVAIDLELSGIPTRQTGSNRGAKPSLQGVYSDAKEAAERYTVLQVGLTVVEEDHENSTYVVRPYNFYISPILREKFKIERIWSCQSGAMDFLKQHGFRHEAPFTEGVPYMSRKEEAATRLIHASDAANRSSLKDIEIKENDVDALSFLVSLRTAIKEWLANDGDGETFLNFPDATPEPSLGTDERRYNELNRFQIRLVHQTVRNEFPKLRVSGRGSWVQITAGSQEADEARHRDQKERIDRNINTAVEFRWLIEALIGGDITGIPPESFQQAMPSDVAIDDLQPLKRFANDLQAKVMSRSKVVVGHNLYLDLLNLYSCFIGELPEKVEDFRTAIHELFPVIIDTKFLATEDSATWNNASDLRWVEKGVRLQETPKIDVPGEFDRYQSSSSTFEHEAGYDSLLTAQIAIKLPVKMEMRGRPPVSRTTGPKLSVHLPRRTTSPGPNASESESLKIPTTPPLSRPVSSSSVPFSRAVTPQPAKWQMMDSHEFGRIKSMFSHGNKFDLLSEQSPEPRASLDDASGSGHRSDSSSSLMVGAQATDTDADGSETQDTSSSLDDAVAISRRVAEGELMPRFNGPFWKIYGNKLRVNACKEGVFNLSP